MSYEKNDNKGEENPKSEKSIYVRDSLIKPSSTFLRHYSVICIIVGILSLDFCECAHFTDSTDNHYCNCAGYSHKWKSGCTK